MSSPASPMEFGCEGHEMNVPVVLACLLCVGPVFAAISVPADALLPDDSSIAQGHDFLKIIGAALKIAPKSEFEATQDHEKRVKRDAAQPVYGSVTVSGQLALRLGLASTDGHAAAYYKFDPEQQQLFACLPYSALRYAMTDRRVISDATPVRIAEKVTVTGSYVGRNAFNTTLRVRRQTLRAVDVLVLVASLRRECTEPMQMTSGDARRLLPTAILVIVGHLESPFSKMFETLGSSPTIQNPVDEHSFIVEAPFVADELVMVSPTDGIIFRQPAPPTAKP